MEDFNVLLKRLRINPLDDIPEAPAYCTINNKPALTAGNFSLITGKKKAGKTFLLGGIIASTINNSIQLETIKGCLPEDKKSIIYFDTEQSHFHAARSIKRICSLVDNSNPENLFAFGLRPLPPSERLDFIGRVINEIPYVGIVAIDGIRDLLTTGINDEQEATRLTNLFLKWSYDFNLHIILLLHQNKNDLNARGHIGSEVVNKAETIISVTKDKKINVFKVACEDARDIEFESFGFVVSKDGLPVAIILPDSKKRKITNPSLITYEKHKDTLHKIFKDELEYTCAELKAKLMDEFNIGRDASERFISYYYDNCWITKEHKGKFMNYRLSNKTVPFDLSLN
jgi:hypothetical protein